MSHAEYMAKPELRALFRDKDRYRLFMGLSLYSFDKQWMREHRPIYNDLKLLEEEQQKNPVRFYAPNTDEQLQFLNTDSGDVLALVDGNRRGKTTAAYVYMLLAMPLIEADRNWEVFKEHGVKYRAFNGPKRIGIATLDIFKLEDPIWRTMVKQWTPDDELGTMGRTYSGRSRKYKPNFASDRFFQFATSQSEIGWYTYMMDPGNYEGSALNAMLWDEQGRESMFHGADRGFRTTEGKHIFSITPHKVEGRHDVGTGSFIYPLLTGQKTEGKDVRVFQKGQSIEDIPDWIYPREQKDKEIEKWDTEPKRNQDRRRQAEGRARLYGEFQVVTTQILSDWTPELSVIDRLWDTPPYDMTLYRGLDHGFVNPTACIWAAVDKNNNVFFFREYYRTGLLIDENVKNIIEASGNMRQRLDTYTNERTGASFPRYEEKFIREYYMTTRLDSRSYGTKDSMTGLEVGMAYSRAGLSTVQPADGRRLDYWLDSFQALLYPDPTRRHVVTGNMGAPRAYVFRDLVNWRREIESWSWAENKATTDQDINSREKPEDKNNHLMTATAYIVMCPLVYKGSFAPSLQQGKEKGVDEPVVRRGRNREMAGLYRRV